MDRHTKDSRPLVMLRIVQKVYCGEFHVREVRRGCRGTARASVSGIRRSGIAD